MNKAISYSKRRKKKNISFLFTLIALLIISSIAYYVSNAAMNNEINSINKEIVSTQKKLDATNAEINSLKKDYDIRNTDKFKEKIAKERLGMVKGSKQATDKKDDEEKDNIEKIKANNEEKINTND